MTLELFDEAPRWRCALLDPPWAERGGGKIKRGADRHYPLAGRLGDHRPILEAVRGSRLWTPADDAHCWMWFTDSFLEDALALVRDLGFTYKRTVVWVKTRQPVEQDAEAPDVRIGIGQYARGAHESMIFATRGHGQAPEVWTGARDVRSVFYAPHPKDNAGKRIHSRKPPESYEVIERVSRGPRIEFFARVPREASDGERWAAWGFDAPEDGAP